MKRSKKIFLAFVAVFVVMLVVLSVDISRKTTFPGSKSQLKERIKKQFGKKDTVRSAPANATHRP
ncbi:MAG: hypothetical protein K1X47_06095 [Cyclobacteriaceae bacterium]|nr:hypothetical protein [Cyclobacteriaceae bacterium]